MQHTSFLLWNLISSVGRILKYHICQVSARSLQLGKPQWADLSRLGELRDMTWRYWAQGPKASSHSLCLGRCLPLLYQSHASAAGRLPWGSNTHWQQKLCSPIARNSTVRQARFGFLLPAAAGVTEAKLLFLHLYLIYTRHPHFDSKIFPWWRIHCSLRGFFQAARYSPSACALWGVVWCLITPSNRKAAHCRAGNTMTQKSLSWD